MNWYYATAEQTQAGPVDEMTLQGLFGAGTITANTLIWRAGMENWASYSSIFSPPARPVCGACKPLAVQKLQEGAMNFGAPVDAEELWLKVQQRGFDFTISSVLSRSWTLIKGNFWPCVGVALLCELITAAAGQVPLISILAAFLVGPQIKAGLSWYFLKQFRGEPATLNDAFAGFRRSYDQFAIYALILFGVCLGIIIVCAAPIGLVFGLGFGLESKAIMWVPGLILIPFVLAIWYFFTCWIFTPLLILDKGLTAMVAMKLSRRVASLHFWKIFGLFLVIGLLSALSLLALIVGIAVMIPVAAAAVVRVYEDAFGDEVVR